MGEEQLIPPRQSRPHVYEVNEETLPMMNKVPVMTQVMQEGHYSRFESVQVLSKLLVTYSMSTSLLCVQPINSLWD